MSTSYDKKKCDINKLKLKKKAIVAQSVPVSVGTCRSVELYNVINKNCNMHFLYIGRPLSVSYSYFCHCDKETGKARLIMITLNFVMFLAVPKEFAGNKQVFLRIFLL